MLTGLVPPLVKALKEAETPGSGRLWDIFILEMKALRPIARMQLNGFELDAPAASALYTSLANTAEELKLSLQTLDLAIKKSILMIHTVWLPRDADNSFNTREKDSGYIRLGTNYTGF